MIDVVAAIMVHQGKVFVAKRAAGQRLAHHWEFPGGKLEPGENPEKALQREMEEEFGLHVHVGEKFDELIHRDEKGTIRLMGYWAQWDGGIPRLTVHEEVAWMEPMLLSPEVFAPADRPFVLRLQTEGLP